MYMSAYVLTVVLSINHYGSETVSSWTVRQIDRETCTATAREVQKQAQREGAKVLELSCAAA